MGKKDWRCQAGQKLGKDVTKVTMDRGLIKTVGRLAV